MIIPGIMASVPYIQTVPIGPAPATTLTFARQGSGAIGYYSMYEVPSWNSITPLPNPPTSITDGVDYSPDRSLLAITSRDSTRIHVYQTTTWTKIPVPVVSGASYWLRGRFSPDGQYYAAPGDGYPSIGIWRTSDWSRVTGLFTVNLGPAYSIAWSLDSKWLIIGTASDSGSNQGLYISDINNISTNPMGASTKTMGQTRHISISPTGSFLAAAVSGINEPLQLFDIPNLTKITGITQPPPAINDGTYVDFCKSSSLMALAIGNVGVHIYDTNTWTIIHTIFISGSWTCRFSDDGTYLAIGLTMGPFLTIYNVSNWQIVSDAPQIPAFPQDLIFT